MDLIIIILAVVTITKDLPISPRLTPSDFLSRCKFSTLTSRQPIIVVELYLLLLQYYIYIDHSVDEYARLYVMLFIYLLCVARVEFRYIISTESRVRFMTSGHTSVCVCVCVYLNCT